MEDKSRLLELDKLEQRAMLIKLFLELNDNDNQYYKNMFYKVLSLAGVLSSIGGLNFISQNNLRSPFGLTLLLSLCAEAATFYKEQKILTEKERIKYQIFALCWLTLDDSEQQEIQEQVKYLSLHK